MADWRFRIVALAALTLAGPVQADSHSAAERGLAVFLDRDLGHCVLCHRVANLDVPFQGNIGPDLSDVAQRLTISQIRAKVADPSISNPATTMPAYFRTAGLVQVARDYAGKPVLSGSQMDDLVAYLATLRGAESGDE